MAWHKPPADPAGAMWARFRRLLGWMAAAAALAALGALAYLRFSGAPMRPSLVISVTVAVFLSVLLAAVLMGLVYLSARSGHDASVDRRWEDEL